LIVSAPTTHPITNKREWLYAKYAPDISVPGQIPERAQPAPKIQEPIIKRRPSGTSLAGSWKVISPNSFS